MQALVSIIIPIYNTEEYLDQCIRSVSEQTWENLEILLLDDGSTDNSLAICEMWSQRDSRIRLFKHTHLGQGTEREIGIRESAGEYIMFVDSDDYIDILTVETAVRRISETNAQICFFSYYMLDKNGDICRMGEDISFAGTENIHSMPEILAFYRTVLWNKCYNGEFLRTCSIGMENCLAEDLLFLGMILSMAERVCVLDAYLYFHRESREGSITQYHGDRFSEVIDVIDKLNAYYKHLGLWEAYWRMLYRLSHEISRDMLSRIRMETNLLHEYPYEYEEIVNEFKRHLGEWFHDRVDMNFHNNRFLLLGGSRLASMLWEICLDEAVSVEDLTGKSIASYSGNAAGKGDTALPEYKKIDYIILDLLEEDWESFGSERGMQEGVSGILGVLDGFREKRGDENTKTVVVKNFFCEMTGIYMDRLERYQPAGRYKTANEILRKAYQYLQDRLPDALFIETEGFDAWRYTDPRWNYGHDPRGYCRIYNASVAIEICVRARERFGETPAERRVSRREIPPGVTDERFVRGFPLLGRMHKKACGSGKAYRYFCDNKIRTVAVYGLGVLGNAFIAAAGHSGVRVAYAIDRVAREKGTEGLEVLGAGSDRFPPVDAIVVTPVQDYWDIVYRMEKKTGIPLISLEDVMDYEQA